jgi:HlyD family type I secretion membrane fusion protein
MTDSGTDQQNLRPTSNVRGVIVFGVVVLFGILGGLIFWGAVAPLESAVTAPATLNLRGERNKVQHLEGGIVSDIRVSEGEHVKKGQLLLKLDSLKAVATLSRFSNQMDQVLAQKARVMAELANDNDIIISGELLERVSENVEALRVFNSENGIFQARKTSFDGQIGILKQRIDQLEKQIKGLKIRYKSRIDQLKIYGEEIIGLRELQKKGFYPKTKVLAMERAIVQLEGFLGTDKAEISRAESARGETRRQIINMKHERNEESASDLQQIDAELADLRERITVARDILQRIEIFAPRAGVIQSLIVHTLGGIIQSGQTLMEIAPQDEELVVEAQVSTVDIDKVQIGQDAEVRLTGLNLKKTLAVYGKVIAISGDAITERASSIPYFLARIEIEPNVELKLGDQARLLPGMPADVLIKTGERTALEYILRPALDAFAKGLNEN